MSAPTIATFPINLRYFRKRTDAERSAARSCPHFSRSGHSTAGSVSSRARRCLSAPALRRWHTIRDIWIKDAGENAG